MTIRPIQRVNFVDQAYQALKQLIVSGDLSPGSQLNIDALSRQLGVSNSPIREALRRLEHERWIETIPFRGAFVRPLDESELLELYEFREIIELAALRKLMRSPAPLAAEFAGVKFPSRTLSLPASHPAVGGKRFQPADVGESIPARAGDILREIVAEIEAAITGVDSFRYLQADARFHQAIVDMAGNRRLSDLFRTLVEQGRSFMLGRTPEAMARCRGEPDEHAQLLEAIERGDRRGAERMLRAHLRISRDQTQENRANTEAADD
jgi:DNA-binding GntR family transcriptional regulator